MSHLRRAHSSAGRASALQAGGHRFEPYCAHHFFTKYFLYGPVVQLVRTLACHARGRRFEPVPGRHFFILSQIVLFILINIWQFLKVNIFASNIQQLKEQQFLANMPR